MRSSKRLGRWPASAARLGLACTALLPLSAMAADAAAAAPLIGEADRALLADYLRDAWRAARQGRELPPPARLEQRAAEIAETLRLQTQELARDWLSEAERAMQDLWRAPPRKTTPLPGQQAT